jgi:hypothetical protein
MVAENMRVKVSSNINPAAESMKTDARNIFETLGGVFGSI